MIKVPKGENQNMSWKKYEIWISLQNGQAYCKTKIKSPKLRLINIYI
jgi:hypothetical protein